MTYTIDFETHKIIDGSDSAPIPVGVSIKYKNDKSHYYAWGHPSNNNCTWSYAKSALERVYKDAKLNHELLVFHNAKFDLRVALEHMSLPIPDPANIADTMIMAYLIDAREESLALKPLAQKYCGIEPDARDDLRDWILAHCKGATQSNWGEFIAQAPGDLVGRYAEADTDMTYTLFLVLEHQVLRQISEPGKQSITDAFNREMKLLPIVIALEQQGINIDNSIYNIRRDLEAKFELLDLQLSAYSDGEKPGSKGMFNALRRKGLIDESKIQYTDKGNPRYGKEFLIDLISDKELIKILYLRSALQKLIGTYLKPFSESADQYDGKFYPYYNQTRSEDDFGTRTGRFSSNIQQLPKNKPEKFSENSVEEVLNDLPYVRNFIVPSAPNRSLVKRDFSGQELRVAAHYAEGSILKAYQDNPKMDVHNFVDNLIVEKTGHHLSRVPVKVINFLKIYGGGAKLLAAKLNIPVDQAYTFFNAYDTALPEFKNLMKDIEKLSRAGKKIRTWGGRSYDVEPSKIINGKRQEFYYKLGNVLIQGSSADMTKEAMIRYFYHPDRQGILLMTVHDELIIEVDDDKIDSEMAILRWAMDEIPGWDVPLRSDGKVGKKLGDMTEYKDEE